MKQQLRLIRTAVGCYSVMGFINELKKKRVYVIGTDTNSFSAGLYLCDKGYIVPKGNHSRFIPEFIKICKIEHPDAILSGPEEEILSLSKNKKMFQDLGILLLCPDYDVVKITSDKLQTYETFKDMKIPTPELYQENNVKFPCIVKPRFGRGGVDIFLVKNQNELHTILKKVKNPLIQEYIEGEEYTIDIFSDTQGMPLSIIPRKRLKVESGICVQGITVNDKKIIKMCEAIAKKLNLIGPSCIQCIKDKKRKIHFFEINPRFGGGSILSIKADPTIITNFIRIIKGEPAIPNTRFTVGLMMLRYYSEYFLKEDQMIQKQGDLVKL